MTYLKCGHAANAYKILKDGSKIPCCCICDCSEKEQIPNLQNRKAVCLYCRKETTSDISLPFFEYGGSDKVTTRCANCGVNKEPHFVCFKCKGKVKDCITCNGTGQSTLPCKHYRPKGDNGIDRYYCGCKGWE